MFSEFFFRLDFRKLQVLHEEKQKNKIVFVYDCLKLFSRVEKGYLIWEYALP